MIALYVGCVILRDRKCIRRSVNIPTIFYLCAEDKRKRGHMAWQAPSCSTHSLYVTKVVKYRPLKACNGKLASDKGEAYEIFITFTLSLLKSTGDFIHFLNGSFNQHQVTVASNSVSATWCMSWMAQTLFITVVRLWLNQINHIGHSKASINHLVVQSYRVVQTLHWKSI